MTDAASRAPRRLAAALRAASRAARDRVTTFGRTVAGTCAALTAVFARWGWHEALAAAVVLAVMLLAALAMSTDGARCEARLSVPRPRVRAGEDVSVEIDVMNRAAAPTAAARARLPIGEGHEPVALPALAPGRSARVGATLRAAPRAVLRVGPLTVRTGDPFGLMRRERRISGHVTVHVHPRIVALDTPHIGILRDLEGMPGGDVVDDDLDLHGLREYREGDDVRHVHWPSAARTGTPMLRQYEASERTDASICLDVAAGHYAHADEFELAVGAHASIGVRALQEDRALVMLAGAMRAAPSDPARLLDLCSAVASDAHAVRDLGRDAFAGAPGASLHCFTVGSLAPFDGLRAMLRVLPRSSRMLVVRVACGAARACRRLPECTLVTIGTLDDLPAVLATASAMGMTSGAAR